MTSPTKIYDVTKLYCRCGDVTLVVLWENFIRIWQEKPLFLGGDLGSSSII